MTVPAHQLSARQVSALADGTSTGADLEILARGQRSKTLAALALAVREAARTGHAEAPAAAAGWDLLARVQRAAQAAAEAMLSYPSTGAWAAEALLDLGAPERRPARRTPAGPDPGVLQGGPGHLAVIAAAAAIRGGVPCRVRLPGTACADAELHLPSLGSLAVPGELRGREALVTHDGRVTEVRWGRARIVLPVQLAASTPCWRPLPRVTVSGGQGRPVLRAIIDDADPHRLPRYNSALDRLSPRQRTVWRQRIAGGWRVLATHHEQAAAEVQALISTLTPLAAADGTFRSTTSRLAFGAIGLSLPADEVAGALALAHEIQHAKLCALMDLLPLVDDRATGLYYAPWRPDPRPLSSVLHGMYAHIGVARFWRRHREVTDEPAEIHHAYVEFARWSDACARVASIVSAGQGLTRSGVIFVDGMMRVLSRWRHEFVPPAARAEAYRAADEHRRQWQRRQRAGTGT